MDSISPSRSSTISIVPFDLRTAGKDFDKVNAKTVRSNKISVPQMPASRWHCWGVNDRLHVEGMTMSSDLSREVWLVKIAHPATTAMIRYIVANRKAIRLLRSYSANVRIPSKATTMPCVTMRKYWL